VDKEPECDLNAESFASQEATAKMQQAMDAALLAKASGCHDFRKLVIGLAQEAADRNII
jgi:hypothetical protein